MLKRAMIFAGLIAILGLAAGCGSNYYSVVKQTAPASGLNKYQQINMGWLDFGEDKYKDYGFEEKDKNTWINLVREANLNELPQFMKELIPGKTIKTAASKKDVPAAQGLVILFSDVKYNQQTSSAAQILFGRMAGSDTLDVTVKFIDGPSGKELYSSSINVSSTAGMDYGSMAFEGRLKNTVYNLCYYIYEQTK